MTEDADIWICSCGMAHSGPVCPACHDLRPDPKLGTCIEALAILGAAVAFIGLLSFWGAP